MFTRCTRCRTKIKYGNSLCENCKGIIIKSKKKSLKNKEAEKTLKTARWQSIRASVVTRDKGLCRLCFKNGIIEYRNLQVHHIVKRTNDLNLAYEPSNLVTLCRSCHEKVELMSVEVQKKMFDIQEIKEDYSIL